MQGRDSVGQTVFDDGPRLDRTDQAVEQPPRVGCYGYVDVLEQLDAFLDGFLVEGVAVRGMGSFAAFRKSRSMMAANLGWWSVAVMSLE